MPQRGTPKKQMTYSDSNETRSVSPVRRSSRQRTPETPDTPVKKNPRNTRDVINRRKLMQRDISPVASDDDEDRRSSPQPKSNNNKRTRGQYEDQSDDEDQIRETAKRIASTRSRRTVRATQATQTTETTKATITYADIERKTHNVSSLNPSVDTIRAVSKRCEEDYQTDGIIYISRENGSVLSPNTTLEKIDGEIIDAYQCKLKFVVSQNGKVVKKGIELHSHLLVSELRKCLKISDSTALYFENEEEEFYLPPTTPLACVFYEIWERSNKQQKVTEEINVIIKDAQTQRIVFLKKGKTFDVVVPTKITYLRVYDILSKESEDFVCGHTLYLGDKPIRDLSKMIPTNNKKLDQNFRFVDESFNIVCTIFLPNTTPQQKTIQVSGSFTGEKLLQLVVGCDKGYNIFRTFGNKQIFDDDYLGRHLSPSVCYVRIHHEKDAYQYDQHTRLDDGYCVRVLKDKCDRETDDEDMSEEEEYQDVEPSDCEYDDDEDDEDDIIDDEVVDQDHYIHVEIQRKLDDDYQASEFHINCTVEKMMQNIKKDFPLSEKYVHKILLPDQQIIDPKTIDQGVPIGCYLKNNSKIIVGFRDCINFKILLPNGDIFEKECNKNWTIAQMLAEKIGVKCDKINCKDFSGKKISVITSDEKSSLVSEMIKENFTLELLLDD